MIYYNEFDHKKVAWLRELIKAGVIANGEVDERSIEDVTAADVVGFKQCHWFAGIGIWSYALRLAGWPDDRECWTLSCPCQPFSAAGKKKGIKDRRHLWPNAVGILRERCPVVCFGEQVSSPDGLAWLDIVRTDLEGAAYTFGAVDLCAAGAGAPHIRNRTFFVADTVRSERRESIEQQARHEQTYGRHESADRTGERSEIEWMAHSLPTRRTKRRTRTGKRPITGSGESIVVAHSDSPRSQRRRIGRDGTVELIAGQGSVAGGLGEAEYAKRRTECEINEDAYRRSGLGRTGDTRIVAYSGMADPDGRQSSDGLVQRSGQYRLIPEDGSTPGPVNGFWRDAGWVLCRPERSGGDPSWRPVEPCTFPLGDGYSAYLGRVCDPSASASQSGKAEARILRLRGFGDAISPEVAARFIQAYCAERGI